MSVGNNRAEKIATLRAEIRGKTPDELRQMDSTAWPEIADPFAEYVTPGFPLEVLPNSFRKLASEKSAQSGFDAGGYAFALLVNAANTIDHRVRMDVGPFRTPAFLWGGIVGDSGKGKSPVMREASRGVEAINADMVRRSRIDFAEFKEAERQASKGEVVEKPAWRQMLATDTTVEALALLLTDNPSGVNLVYDEITEFIGRMDAYGAQSGGKDRGVYLRAFDGGQVTINRATRAPLVVEDFSVGILAGMQPEKLAYLFKKSGGGSDGLYQRFLMYALRPAGEVDYCASVDPYTEVQAEEIFETLHHWTEQGVYRLARLEDQGRLAMQDYHNAIRTLSFRTAAQRFAEHLDKFPGLLGRVTFALHCIECAERGEFSEVVTVGTLNRAMRIMQTLYRHSEAVYAVLDTGAGDVMRLVKSAAEAILARGWDRFKRGDLTRRATYWKAAEHRQAESALDYLIELGWIIDITPPPVPGKRGRRSDGEFLVNPQAHITFSEHAVRIRRERAERYESIKKAASGN